MKKRYQFILMLFFFLFASIYQYPKPTKEIKGNASSYVHLEGAFLYNGDYSYENEMTIQQLINQVGIKEDANLEALNLNAPVKDESSLYLPQKNKEAISLNQATIEELMTLKGIGEKTANKIIEYRQENQFIYIEDIMKIKGIGEKTYLKLRDYLCL